MNEKIQAILLKITIELKKLGWTTSPDWQITLKSEEYVSLVKDIGVSGEINDNEFKDNVQTHIDMKLLSSDEVTYFPEYTVYANLFIDSVGSKDLSYKMDVDVSFMDKEFTNENKIVLAAKKIDRRISDYIEKEFESYVSDSSSEIEHNKLTGLNNADQDFERWIWFIK